MSSSSSMDARHWEVHLLFKEEDSSALLCSEVWQEQQGFVGKCARVWADTSMCRTSNSAYSFALPGEAGPFTPRLSWRLCRDVNGSVGGLRAGRVRENLQVNKDTIESLIAARSRRDASERNAPFVIGKVWRARVCTHCTQRTSVIYNDSLRAVWRVACRIWGVRCFFR